MKLATNMWVAVLDGAHGIIFANEGTALAPHLVARKTYRQDNPPAHEQGRDRPGRVHESMGHGRSGVEIPDPHQKAEDTFVNAIIAELAHEATNGAFEKLVIVAPPVALGVLRKHIGHALAPYIVKEIAADYTKMPVAEITAAVVKALELK